MEEVVLPSPLWHVALTKLGNHRLHDACLVLASCKRISKEAIMKSSVSEFTTGSVVRHLMIDSDVV